jgi:NAD+ synthase (glutamine-hydrolysing)
VRVLLAAVECAKGGLEGNLGRHLAVVGDGVAAGCEVVVFPEMSLTGSVDPTRRPERLVGLDHPVVERLVAAADGVGVLFGIAEEGPYITQVYAADGRVVAVQRKRHLGDDEIGFRAAAVSETVVFEAGGGGGGAGARCGVVICAEAGVGRTWDACAAAGAEVLFMCAAPGLYGRRTDAASWRRGFEWWEGCGLGDARRHARRLGRWVALATQAGSTEDEDFPGIAALVSPQGEVVDRLPDWRAGTLVVDVPTVVT